MAQLTIVSEGVPPRHYVLKELVTTLGRSVDNVLEVPDPNMSRRHCVIEKRGDGDYILTDCNSSNGTRVNGERVLSHELKDGDRIEVGSTILMFGVSEDSAMIKASQSPTMTRPDRGNALTTSVRKNGAVKTDAAVLAHERDDLRKLLEINKRLNQEHNLRKLLETIIDSAIELMAAERGFLILLQDSQMRVEIARNMSRDTLDTRSGLPQVSTQICREVIETGKTVLTTNAAADMRYGRYSSVAGLNLRSILCVPFKIKEQVLGTVYLDNANVGAFSERDADLLSAFSDQAAVAIENARLIRQVKKKERMEQELKIANEIQKKLLPRKTPRVQGLELYGWMHPAKQVGGDYYDFIPVPGGLLIAIGDVSGKGVPAGLVMASARSTLRTLAEREQSTREIVISMNRLLADDLDCEMFISFLLMRFDTLTGRIQYTGAGHEHIIIYKAEENRIESRRTGGMVLGLKNDIGEHVKEEEIQLDVGDALVLYTDGVTEAVDERNDQFQLERLEEAVKEHCEATPRDLLHGILAQVLKWKGKAPQKDDITLVTVRRTPPDQAPSEVADEATVSFTNREEENNTDIGPLL